MVDFSEIGTLSPSFSQGKPAYRVPSMAEIAALSWNGLTVVSTFSGCGGSCLGYRMAGYKILWANEFLPAAQASYRANASTDCVLDSRDIHYVQVQDILDTTGLHIGELDLFDGSPPCQAFSTAGKRDKGWGHAKQYANGIQQKNELLFTEYIRLLRGLQPKTFVAENVSGLVKGVAKGYFKEILAGLKACGYRVQAKLLDAQWLGVPQKRQRIIFVGIRNDLGKLPVFPKPLPYRYSVGEALFTSASVLHDESGKWSQGVITARTAQTARAGQAVTMFIEGANGFNQHEGRSIDFPMPTVQAQRPVAIIESPGNDVCMPSPVGRRKLTIAELKRLCAFPDDFVLLGSYSQQWERLGNSVPPIMMQHIACAIAQDIFGQKHCNA
jgi:DNA (cytosine-5)-methyltransferase 1